MPLMLKATNPEPCEECGMDPVHHGRERLSLAADMAFRKLALPFDRAFRRLVMPLADSLLDFAAPAISRILFSAGLAVKVPEPDKHFSEGALAMWNEAKARGIEMYEVRLFGLPRRQFVARHKGKSLSFEGLPRPARAGRSLLWMDDKMEVKRRFRKAGFPVPEGGSAWSERGALRIFRSLRPPVAVKPREGSGGRHTTVDICAEEELLSAYRKAKEISPGVMVEEQMSGPVFRATVIDGRPAAILRRDPPQVVGDGRSTVRELVAEENKNPLRRGPVFAEIKLGPAAARELARQNLSVEDVPAKGRIVRLHFKVNWGVGGTSRDATAEAHPDNVRLFNEIGAYLGEHIVGIDFMIPDIGISWRRQRRCGVIECNSLPAIGNHHFPFTGPARNVAGAIWDMVFPGSGGA